jgi:flagellin
MVSTNGFGGSGGISRNLERATNDVNKSLTRLATGKRINSAADDAAGLAIASQLANLGKLADVGNLNISYGVSALQIADSTLGQVSEVTTRLSELSAQSANGTLSDEQRGALSQEFEGLKAELNRIAQTTEFNGVNLFSGQETNVQVNESSQIAVGGTNLTAFLDQVNSLNIGSQSGALAAVDATQNLSSQVSSARGQIGAGLQRLDTAFKNNSATSENLRAAEARIRDSDVAEESANLTAAKIRQQSSLAVGAQSRLTADVVRSLLQ